MSPGARTAILTPPRVPLRVAIIEDDRRILDSLELLVDGTPELRCVGAFGSAEAGLAGLAAAAPDVVLLDIQLPGLSGIEALARLKALLPNVPVLMLTVYEDSETVFDALRHGASGFLTKRTAPAALLEAIQQVHAGGSPMSPHIARKVVQHFHRLGPSVRPAENLTAREIEVLSLLAQGRLYKEIADQLGIAHETVRSHLSSIYAKLQVRTRTEAVVKFLGRPPGPE